MSSQILGQTETLPTDKLTTYYQNPRRGDTDAIAESLRVNGQFRPLVVNKGTHTGRPYEVLAGNHTLLAARSLDGTDDAFPRLDAYIIDVDEDHARRIVLADNRTSDLAEYDNEALLELLELAEDVAGTGYTQKDLEGLTAVTNKALEELESLADDLEGDENFTPADSTPPWIQSEDGSTGEGEEDAEEEGFHYSTSDDGEIEFHIKKNDPLLALAFSVTPAQRTMIRAVLADVRRKHDLDSQSTALVHIITTHPDIDQDEIVQEYEKAVNAPVEGDTSAGEE